MFLIHLPNTISEIIRKNDHKVFCVIYKNKKGLFRKDIHESKIFGRKVCDEVKRQMGNNGFFTSDELPNYGISQEEVDYILGILDPRKNDLLVFYAYSENEAKCTNKLFNDILSRYLSCKDKTN